MFSFVINKVVFSEDENTFKKRIDEMQKKKQPAPPKEDNKKHVQQSAKPNLQQPTTVKAKVNFVKNY